MAYTKIFQKPYPNGYKDRPDTSTPETAAILNAKDAAFEHIEDYLHEQKVSDLQNDLEFVKQQDMGTELAKKADKLTTYTKDEVDALLPDNMDVIEELSEQEGKLAYKGEVVGGGGNANERELSWAEYQALSEAEKMNGTNYYVPDAPSGSGGGGSSHVDFENYDELGTLRFGVDGDGNYGYYKADDSFVPFKSGGNAEFVNIGALEEKGYIEFEVPKDGLYLITTIFNISGTNKFVSNYFSKGTGGNRAVYNSSYDTIVTGAGSYPLSSILVTRTETDDSVKFKITKDAYTSGNVLLSVVELKI